MEPNTQESNDGFLHISQEIEQVAKSFSNEFKVELIINF